MFATANRPFGFPSWQSSWSGIQNWVHCPHVPRDPFHKMTSVAWLLHFHPSSQWVNSVPPYVQKLHFMYEVIRTSSKYRWSIDHTSSKCRWNIYRTSRKCRGTLRVVHKAERSSSTVIMWYSKSGCPWPALNMTHFFVEVKLPFLRPYLETAIRMIIYLFIHLFIDLFIIYYLLFMYLLFIIYLFIYLLFIYSFI